MDKILGTWVEVEVKEYDKDLKFWDVVDWREILIKESGDIDAYVCDIEGSLKKGQKRGKIYTNVLVRCGCGAEVLCREFTNECDECGEMYNKYGQHLRPVDEWEDEY